MLRVVSLKPVSCLRVLVCVLAAGWSGASLTARAGSAGGIMDISEDGRLLAVSNRDSGTVSIVDIESRSVRHEVAVGTHPEGVSFVGGTHRVAAAVYDSDQVVVFDADTGKVSSRIDVFDEPFAIVSDSDERLFVTLEHPGQVVEIDLRTGRVQRELPAGKFPRGLAFTSDRRQLLVTGYLDGLITGIDVASGQPVDAWPSATMDNLVRHVVVHPQRPKAYFAHIRSKVTAHQGTGSIFPYVSVVDLVAKTSDESMRRKRIPMDSFVGTFVPADPSEVALSSDGRRFYVLFGGTDDMFLCETVDDDYREIEFRQYARVGRNPRGIKVSPESGPVFVYNALDFEVAVLDPVSLKVETRIPVTKNPLGDEVLRGKVLFYSALQPMTDRRWISCASCHPDGQPDGRTWHNPEGLRNTPPLGGLAFTHPQHWSADRDETQDFEHTIRGPLMSGRGLLAGRLNASLAAPNKGLSKDLDALSAYTNSHRVRLSPYARNGLSAAAQRGRTLFESKETGCAACHSGPFFTDSQSGRASRRHDVGTGGDDPTEKMGPEYDTPMLLNLYRSAPYLHHGRAETLQAVLTTENKADRHGRTSHLSPAQVDDLVEFLKALPFEADPEKAAEAAGITRVDR